MFKNENGFSLVELAIAAGLAVALAATAVTILSGTTATLSSKANGAAGTSTTYNSDVLANASGAAGNAGGNNAATGTLSAVVNAPNFGWGSSFTISGSTVRMVASTDVNAGWNGTQAALDVLTPLKVGDKMSFTVGGVTETHTVTSIVTGDPAPGFYTIGFDTPWTATVNVGMFSSASDASYGTVQFEYM